MQYVVFISVDQGKLHLHEWINDKNLKSCSFPSKKTKKKEKSSRIFFDIPLKKKTHSRNANQTYSSCLPTDDIINMAGIDEVEIQSLGLNISY